MKLIIDREEWLRGEGSEDSYLLRVEDGKMCCLGFFGRACGVPDEAMEDVMTPAETPHKWDGGEWLRTQINLPRTTHDVSEVCKVLMETNDDEYISDTEREEKIIKIFAEQGVEVEFIN